MIRAFSFLQRDPNSGILSFRLRVPLHLQKVIGKAEIKKSLRTADKRLAMPVAFRLYSELQDHFKRLEDGEPMQKPKRQKKLTGSTIFEKITVAEIVTPGGTKAKGITIDTGDDTKDAKIARELLGSIQAKAPTAPATEDSAKLARIAKKYRAEKVAEGSWTPKTAAEHEAGHELLIQIVGNVETSTVTHKTAREFKDTLMKLPANMTKGKYAGKTVKQIIAMNPPEADKMAPKTVNEKLQRISSFFLWAVRHGYAAVNVFDGLKLKENRRARDQRAKFDDDDLKAIFHPSRYSLEKLRKPFKYWLPLLALYTGGRAQELAQLRTVDVIEEGGMPAIRITEEAGRLKNLASARTIPLHPRIVELGFLQHVAKVKAAGHERLFHEAWDTSNGPGDKISRSFAVYRKSLNIGSMKRGDGKPVKCFHSFRHNFADGLKQAGAEPLKISELMGHSDGNISTSRYSGSYISEKLYPVVCLLDFDLEMKI